ncbi:MAG: hypothetical protein H6Q86_2050, partial [candidate division NC10 bacterium]|nr:hypothetical protein [candidate division NC10 bacterium]
AVLQREHFAGRIKGGDLPLDLLRAGHLARLLGPLRRALRLDLDGPAYRHGRDDGGHEQDNPK